MFPQTSSLRLDMFLLKMHKDALLHLPMVLTFVEQHLLDVEVEREVRLGEMVTELGDAEEPRSYGHAPPAAPGTRVTVGVRAQERGRSCKVLSGRRERRGDHAEGCEAGITRREGQHGDDNQEKKNPALS